jgi:ribonuclease HI
LARLWRQKYSFFHRFASARRSKKHLWDIEDDDGLLHHSQEGIKSAAYKHFNSFFKVTSAPHLAAQVELASLFPKMVTTEEAIALEAPCTKEELFVVLKGFKKEKSPGPDGWSVELYLHFFDLMFQDLLDAVEDSRIRGVVSPQLNRTFVVLIPKSNLPKHFQDFRPISLCNLCYKLISKIIARRIRPFLSLALSDEQLGFLKGRQILDVVGVAHECIHSLKTKKQQATLLKLDLKKAFDCINWNFLHLVLIQCGFGLIITNWILGCISSASLAILINGEATRSFHCERGLRQGCPLSPLLFILVLEGLSILLKINQAEGHLTGIKISGQLHILHLLFVDDVLILTSADPDEWSLIHSILNNFCSASGLEINFQKSIFLVSNTQETFLSDITTLFGMEAHELEKGFSYLGFFLKSSRYTSKDWHWLFDKFNSKIHHWCNRLLSLGGRFVLIKSVLESLPVYWMALAHIPASILKTLRQLIFSFLWSGSKKNKGYHLCKWESISKPKSMGGWGLRHLPFFYRALSANTFWRILMKPGLWSLVIKAKYFPSLPVHIWIRSASDRPNRGSIIWKHLSLTLPIILHWISWNPGNGQLIEVGRDCILGLGRHALLSAPLLAHLHRKNIFFLHQIISPSNGGLLGDHWLSGEELQLDFDLYSEWIGYTQSLMEAGIRLQDRPDVLLWTGGDQSGSLTAKNVYLALASFYWSQDKSNRCHQIWKADCPVKLKLFFWLLIENRILVWTNLQARGWEGPSRCYLCQQQSETIPHLFITCPFIRAVWQILDPSLLFYSTWSGPCVLDCFQRWISVNKTLTLLPVYLIWQVWKSRNSALFDGKSPSAHYVANTILIKVDLQQTQPSIIPKRRHHFAFPLDRVVAWFDGASQQSGSLCGAGGKIMLNTHTCYRWIINCGNGSNMKAELMGAWASLNLARRLHIDELLLLGDSKIIVDWLKGQADFKVAALESWKERTKETSHCFRKLSVTHIFREENSEADTLSKKALYLSPGHFCFTKWEDGNEGPTIKIKL